MVNLRDEARHFLSCFDNLQSRVKAAGAGLHGRLRIGLTDFLAPPYPGTLLEKYRAQEPDTQITIFNMTTSEMLNRLRRGLIDIGISLDGDAPGGYYVHGMLCIIPLLCSAEKAALYAARQHNTHPVQSHHRGKNAD